MVECRTKDGITGTGFSYALTGGGSAIKALIDDTLQGLVLDTDILQWDRVWHQLYQRTHRLGRGVSLPAISAIDIAMWDIKGKVAGLPLYQLLGQQQEKVLVYGSGRANHQMTTEELIEGALVYKEEGYSSIKLRAGALGLEEDVRRIKAVKQEIGEMRIMVDCNERLNYEEALWLGQQLQDLDVFWMEEPLISENVTGHKKLAEKLNMPIAVGEHLHGRFEFVNYIENNSASIFQPDCPLVGGISEWKRIATIAEGFGLSISPHFLPELHIHLAASTTNCISIEHFPLIDDVLEETLTIKNGYGVLPEAAGHSIKWDAEKIDYYQKL
nr:mandelate racemase/muconate lactonizing enzyme family protein [Thalassobacillus sp. CUG 92003]